MGAVTVGACSTCQPVGEGVVRELFAGGRERRPRSPRGLPRITGSLPGNLAEIARRARTDGLQIQIVHRNLDFFIREMDRSSNRLSFAIVIAAIVVASSIMVHAAAGPQAFGYPLLGLAGFVAAGVLGLGLAIGILRSGRL